MKNLFVDVGKNIDVLSEVQFSYSWAELKATEGEPYHDAADDREESLSGARLPFFVPLSDWIKSVRVQPSHNCALDYHSCQHRHQHRRHHNNYNNCYHHHHHRRRRHRRQCHPTVVKLPRHSYDSLSHAHSCPAGARVTERP
jgi:hypothetical protein